MALRNFTKCHFLLYLSNFRFKTEDKANRFESCQKNNRIVKIMTSNLTMDKKGLFA